ncbi:MAG: tyrosine--tRNA ligase [Bacteroidales bacterium]|nr:tyrosine--tRNA ligase [Bacteroidales bacterium]MCF8327234.1 tyrosine--tRNA ligase [Bacteroidales bacterium]
MNFVEELTWRGMVHDIMPGTEELLDKEMVTAYVGIDPTADSLHIGHLTGVMMLKHLQDAGHRPVVLLGGATGMIGDPSGKSKERNLLDENALRKNQYALELQLQKLLDFSQEKQNQALLVNNYDWMKDFSFLEFIRDVGKHLTVNYMMAKDSVKKRLGADSQNGMSFTEFSYQLVQGYDFYYLYKNLNCKLQMGGSDQWGNITTGTELIRRKSGGEAFALTCPLITKSDGNKFGKTEEGNIWLDPEKTSPYKFYQFWLNISDEDATRLIKIFSLKDKATIESLIEKHQQEPHLRVLQKEMAVELTTRIHGEKELQAAQQASKILFGKQVTEELKALPEKLLLEVFEGVPQHEAQKTAVEQGMDIVTFLAEASGVFSSKGEARRMLKSNAVSINKVKVDENRQITAEDLLNDKYILVQKGKKNYFLVRVK